MLLTVTARKVFHQEGVWKMLYWGRYMIWQSDIWARSRLKFPFKKLKSQNNKGTIIQYSDVFYKL